MFRKEIMRYLLLMLLCVVLTGCPRNTQPVTAGDRAAEEEMMRNVLNDSSPRNMNEHPKVTDEFKKRFNTRNGRIENAPDAPLDKQSEDDEESWW